LTRRQHRFHLPGKVHAHQMRKSKKWQPSHLCGPPDSSFQPIACRPERSREQSERKPKDPCYSPPTPAPQTASHSPKPDYSGSGLQRRRTASAGPVEGIKAVTFRFLLFL
jgi:hypothetical protein